MDLQTLSRQPADQANPGHGPARATASVPPPRRRWVSRVALPAAIVLATLLLLAYAAGDWLLPARAVEVRRAIAVAAPASTDTTGDQPASAAPAPTAVVAQAPGWVEPDPYPIYVTTLADGVVERIHVLEGETVEAGQTLVELVADDARLALAQARAELARREAALAAAQTDFDEPVALTREAAVARAQHAEAEAALARLDAEITKEQARLDELAAAYERLAGLGERSVSAQQVEAAQYQMTSQRAVVEATRQRRPQLEALVEAAAAQLAAAQRELALKTQLTKAREEAAADVAAARAAVDEAALRLERMTLRSPADGVVMSRLVAPGDKLKLAMDGRHSAHAIHLYDPRKLQVRVDVPLADAAAVGADQRAKVVVDVLPDVEFNGTVTRLVHQADIAKNTVQFKVAIEDPSPLLKPDMLARVKFLGRAAPGGGGADAAPLAISVTVLARPAGATGGQAVALPRSALVDDPQDGAFVWWVSPTDRRLARRAVTVGAERDGDLVEVRRGLNPGDVVVERPDDSLAEGQRVRIREGND
jgi:multidrug efflux pump subunit AcrA (membrane-fusion protein)